MGRSSGGGQLTTDDKPAAAAEPVDSPLSDVFQFTAGPLASRLEFSPRPRDERDVRKRSRPLNDVDGEYSSESRKKKRRLRLFLITSRLSPVFSQPATYIVDRGSSKIAVWAKQKALGRNLLRKAAILNRIRQRERIQQQSQQYYSQQHQQHQQPQHQHQQQPPQAQHPQQQPPPQLPPMLPQRQLEMARETFMYGSHDTLTHPVVCTPNAPFPADRHPLPTTPSPVLIRGPYRDHHQAPPHECSKADDCPSCLSRKTMHHSSNASSSASTSSAGSGAGPSTLSPNYHHAYHSLHPPPQPHLPHSLPSAQVPRRDYIPLPPSPLGLSNYDAFDLESDADTDFTEDDDADDDDGTTTSLSISGFGARRGTGGDGSSTPVAGLDWSMRDSGSPASPPTIYSDFSVLDPMEAVVEDHDLIEAFAGTSTTAGMGVLEEVGRRARRMSEAAAAEREREEEEKRRERLVEIEQEKGRQRDLMFGGLGKFM